MGEPTTYNFGPRSTAGIIGSVSGVNAIAAGVFLAIALLLLITGAGLLPALAALIVGGVLVVVRFAGITGVEWVLIASRSALTFATGPSGEAGMVAVAPPTTTPAEEVEVVDSGRWGALKVEHDYVLVMELSSSAEFVLAADEEKDAAVENWATFLASLAREASPIRSVQIVERALSVPGSAAWRYLRSRRDRVRPDSLEHYGALLERLGDHEAVHATFLALRITPQGRRDPLARCVSEAEAVLARLRAVGITATPLNAADLRFQDALLTDPDVDLFSRIADLDDLRLPSLPRAPIKEHFGVAFSNAYRSATFEIVEWPRADVLADWLFPLLACSTRGERTLSIHITPLSPWKAQRLAERRSTNAASELRRKSQLGFETHARDIRALEAVTRVEDELASGHVAVAISGVISVAARSAEDLDVAIQQVQDAASSSRIFIRRMWGRQKEGRKACRLACTPPRRRAEQITTTRHAGSLYPLQVPGDSGVPGLALGWNALSHSVIAYDPFELYAAGQLTSPGAVVIGRVGRGKSAFVKSYLWRAHEVGGYKVWVAGDPKGEYKALAEALALPVISLVPGGTTRINPLDPGNESDPEAIARQRQQLLGTLAATQLGRDLTPVEVATLGAVVSRLERNAELQDAVSRLLNIEPEIAAALVMERDVVQASTHDLALVLHRLVAGSLRGMFDGKSTLELGNAGGVIDLSGVLEHEASLVPIMVCATTWITNQLVHRKDNSKHIIVLDEAWQALRAAGVADWLQSVTKLARQFGAQVLLVLHRLSDLDAIGADSDAVVKKARGIVSDCETVVCFAQAEGELDLTRAALGLSSREAELLPTLPQGRCLMITGRHHALVDVELTDLERRIADTNSAMLVR